MRLKYPLFMLLNMCMFVFADIHAVEIQPTKGKIDIKECCRGCERPERGPPGPPGPPGLTPIPIFASYSIPWPEGAEWIDTYEPLPFTAAGLNANFPAIGGIVLDSATGIFTIPVTGFYEISYGYSSTFSSGTIVGLGIFTGIVPTFDHIVPHSSISQGIGAQYQMTSGNLIIPLFQGDRIALINTNNAGPPPDGNVPTDFEGLAPYPATDGQEQSAAYITFKKVG